MYGVTDLGEGFENYRGNLIGFVCLFRPCSLIKSECPPNIKDPGGSFCGNAQNRQEAGHA